MTCPVTGCDRPHDSFAAHAHSAWVRRKNLWLRNRGTPRPEWTIEHCSGDCAYRVCPHRVTAVA